MRCFSLLCLEHLECTHHPPLRMRSSPSLSSCQHARSPLRMRSSPSLSSCQHARSLPMLPRGPVVAYDVSSNVSTVINQCTYSIAVINQCTHWCTL
jgi:hypothetical protein